jgi:hypothetical protein
MKIIHKLDRSRLRPHSMHATKYPTLEDLYGSTIGGKAPNDDFAERKTRPSNFHALWCRIQTACSQAEFAFNNSTARNEAARVAGVRTFRIAST